MNKRASIIVKKIWNSDDKLGTMARTQLSSNSSYKFLIFFVLLLEGTFTSGCLLLLGAGAGAGGAAYIMGKLDAELDGTVSQVHSAAVKGIKDLNMPLVKNQVDKLTAKLESKTADEKKVFIDIDFVTEKRTKISIRVGLIGDEVRSRKILDSIRKHL